MSNLSPVASPLPTQSWREIIAQHLTRIKERAKISTPPPMDEQQIQGQLYPTRPVNGTCSRAMPIRPVKN